MAFRRNPHKVFFLGKHFAVARFDLEIDDKAEFEEALAVLLPAVADRLGVGDDPLAFLELVGGVLLVKPVTARLALDEGRLTYGQRRFLPSLVHSRLAALDFLKRLGLGGGDT